MDPCQGKLQKDLDYAHIPMYAVIWVKPAYIIFHVFLGMIKETSKDKKWSIGSIGSKESATRQGKAIQSVIHLEW